jgi:hypothetical protein
MGKAAAPNFDETLLRNDATQLAALGTGLLLAQLLGLLSGRFFERSRRQSLGRRHGHFFHLGQIDIEPWPFITKGPPDDDFAPAVGELLDVLQIFG